MYTTSPPPPPNQKKIKKQKIPFILRRVSIAKLSNRKTHHRFDFHQRRRTFIQHLRSHEARATLAGPTFRSRRVRLKADSSPSLPLFDASMSIGREFQSSRDPKPRPTMERSFSFRGVSLYVCCLRLLCLHGMVRYGMVWYLIFLVVLFVV